MQIADPHNRLIIDPTWTLFLDRDGVLNRRIVGDYVREWNQFEFLPGVLEALRILEGIFPRIIVVTNQQGIAKGYMTERTVNNIHENMIKRAKNAGGRVNAVFYCPHLKEAGCECRKPETGMALQAKKDFPDIDFSKSVVVGDSRSDIGFGKNIGAVTVLIKGKEDVPAADYVFSDLREFADFVNLLSC